MDKRMQTTTLSLELSGAWDLSRGNELQALLRPAEKVDELVLNLSKVTIVDASFLTSLVVLINRMVARNRFGVIRIVGASPNIIREFQACRLETLFDFQAAHVPRRPHFTRGTIMQRISAAD